MPVTIPTPAGRWSKRRVVRRVQNNADALNLLSAAIMSADIDRVGTAARVNRIVNALNDPTVSNGFRNVITQAFSSEQGGAIDLADITGLTPAQGRAFARFARSFVNTYATLLVDDID